MSKKLGPNGTLNHIACSVVDLEGFIQWYSKYLGFRQVGKIVSFDRETDPEHGIFAIYGSSLQKGRCGFLVSQDGVGLEVFQFDLPQQQGITDPFQYDKSGVFHICLTEADPRGLSEKLQAVGAKPIGKPIDVYQDNKVWCLYLTDPWGNVIELLGIDFVDNALGLSGMN